MTASRRNDLQDEMARLLNTAVSDLRSSSIQDLEFAGRRGSGIASPSTARPGSSGRRPSRPPSHGGPQIQRWLRVVDRSPSLLGATGAHHLEENAVPECPWRYAFTAYVSRTTSRTRDRPARICAFW